MKYCNTKLIPLAHAILSDGRLWGRILTSTGVNLGGGGLVAGVRGTSVSIMRTPTTQNYTIAIIDSTRTGIDAATIASTSTPSLTPTSVSSGTYLSYTSGTSTIPTGYVKSKTELLNIDPWISNNTRADIDYLYAKSGSLAAGDTRDRVINELVATISLTTPPTILDALCTDGAATRSYWTSLIPYTRYLDKCRESTLLAFADYTDSANSNSATLGIASPLIFSGSTIRAGGTGSMSFEGYSITATGQYISYAPGAFDRIGGLADKTITITVDGLLNITTNKTLVDFGVGLRIKTVTGGYNCLWSGSNCVTENTVNKTLTFTVPTSNISAFVIGNNSSPISETAEYTTPIGATIKNIQISN